MYENLNQELTERLTDFEFGGRILHEKQVEAIIAVVEPIIKREKSVGRANAIREVAKNLPVMVNTNMTNGALTVMEIIEQDVAAGMALEDSLRNNRAMVSKPLEPEAFDFLNLGPDFGSSDPSA